MKFTEDDLLTIIDWFNGYFKHYYSDFDDLPVNQQSVIKKVMVERERFISGDKGCVCCKQGEPLNDTSNSNFVISMDIDQDGCYIQSDYDDGDYSETSYTRYIHYCPVCGRKLDTESC